MATKCSGGTARPKIEFECVYSAAEKRSTMSQASGKVSFSSPAMAKQFVQITIVFAAYFIAGKLGQATTNMRSGNLGPVWPAYGIALAAILIYGYRVWVGIAVAAFVIALWSPVPPMAAAGQATGATVGALTGALLLQRLKFQNTLARLRDALAFIVLGAFGSALVSASIGTFVLYATHLHSYSGIGAAWLIYWLGDSTGALLITPLILTAPQCLAPSFRGRWAEFAALLLLLIWFSVLIFSDFFLTGLRLDVLSFALLAFVMWAAIRFGMCGAALVTFIIAALGTIEAGLGSGAFSHNTPFINAVLLDVFFTVLAVSGMSLAAVIAEREHARREGERLVREQAAMEMRLRLATIVETSEDAIIGLDLNRTITDWNKAAQRQYGYSAEEVIGRPVTDLIPAERNQNCTEMTSKVKQGLALRHYETLRQRKDGTQIEVSLTASPIFSAEGQVVGISSIERDVTERKRREESLRNSEERFRLAAQAGKMFAYEWDAASDSIMRSAESSQMLGIDESTLLRGDQALAMVHPEDRADMTAAIAALSPQKPNLRVSYRILRPDGSIIWVDQHSVAHFDKQDRLLRIVGMVVDVTERKRAEEALASTRSRLIAAQEDERRRIARELHDDIGQRLALLTVQLEQLRVSSPDLSTEVRQHLDELRHEALEMATDIQSLSHELHSARLEYLGIASAAKGFCREFAETKKVEIDCDIHELPKDIEPAISLCLFRVLQEGLQNSVKHSGVEHFEVRMWADAAQIHLSVSDAGAGFDRAKIKEGRGLGLISMEERVKLLNGKLSIESKPNRGTTIHASLPLTPKDRPKQAAAGD